MTHPWFWSYPHHLAAEHRHTSSLYSRNKDKKGYPCRYLTLTTKKEVLHAESNAIAKCAKWMSSTDGATLYVTLSPCFECSKMIIQAGIKEVIYLSDKYDGTDGNLVAKHLFDTCGVKYTKMENKNQKELIISLKPDVGIKYTEKKENK